MDRLHYATKVVTSIGVALLAVPLSACVFGPAMRISDSDDGRAITISGEIGADSAQKIMKYIEDHPIIDEIILEFVPGSFDDDANLELATFVHARGLSTIVRSDGVIASGGVDLFLAGVRRTIAPGACVGVHSWGGYSDEGILAGRDVPRTDVRHRPYLDYFERIGVDEAFYWFTLEAAPIDELHWMTPTEMNRFAMSDAPLTPLTPAEIARARARCAERGA